jgi:outer membrane protein TolC
MLWPTMRSLPNLVVLVSVLVAGVVASSVGGAAADPVSAIWHLAPQDGGTGSGPSTPAPVIPPAPTVEPLLGDVAGPSREVSLADVLALLVRTSPDLDQARIDREIAEIAVERAQTWKDWTVAGDFAVASRGRGASAGQATSVSLSGDVSRMFSTGGTLALHADAAWGRIPGFDDGDPTTSDDAIHTWTEGVSATFAQPLLRGKGEALVRAAERGARLDVDAAVLAERAVAIDAVRAVVLAYFDLVDAESNLDIQRSSLDLARERLRVTQAGIKAGGVAESETISVEQAIATREEAAMASELAVINSSLALRRLIGMEIGPGQIALSSKIDLAVPQHSWDNATLIEQALAFSPELARLKSLDAGATLDIEVTENGLLPQLDAALTFGPNGVGTTFGAASKNLATFDDFTAIGSLSYRSTLGERAAHADVRSARARREKVRVTADDIKRQIVQAVSSAVAQVQTAERRFAIAARAVTLAEKNLAVEQARLGLGRSRNVDVLIRQDELRAAQLRQSQAVLDWHRAATVIAALTGELLPTYGISIDDRQPVAR